MLSSRACPSPGAASVSRSRFSSFREFYPYYLGDSWAYGYRSQRIRELLADVRREGFAVNPGLIVEGSWGMAAAVFDATGTPVYALSLTGIEPRFSGERRQLLGRALLTEAHRLSRELGHR